MILIGPDKCPSCGAKITGGVSAAKAIGIIFIAIIAVVALVISGYWVGLTF